MKDFTKMVRSKGWTMLKVSKRWGLSTRRLSMIAADPSQRDWDAANGLPDKNQEA